ncbi:hypothetical protein [uncultured Vagococcus sp.]|uniref:hypothetical protein n=1 Tax=uncultured Vagococcus sp. TaxID=189676 RepID=UPI0028D3B1E1|nr:hypothetical protein [uncultured Vagococcus sp.]
MSKSFLIVRREENHKIQQILCTALRFIFKTIKQQKTGRKANKEKELENLVKDSHFIAVQELISDYILGLTEETSSGK